MTWREAIDCSGRMAAALANEVHSAQGNNCQQQRSRPCLLHAFELCFGCVFIHDCFAGRMFTVARPKTNTALRCPEPSAVFLQRGIAPRAFLPQSPRLCTGQVPRSTKTRKTCMNEAEVKPFFLSLKGAVFAICQDRMCKCRADRARARLSDCNVIEALVAFPLVRGTRREA